MQNRLALAVILTAGLLSTPVFAQSQDEQQLCMDDAFKVCGHTIPDRNRTIACMVQNKPQLSAACQVVMDKYAPGGDVSRIASAPSAAPARTVTRNAAMKPVTPAKPIKTAIATQRAGKPLNILMR